MYAFLLISINDNSGEHSISNVSQDAQLKATISISNECLEMLFTTVKLFP